MHAPSALRAVVFCAAALAATLPFAAAQPPPPPPPAGRALFYTEPNYRGECLVVEAGGSSENLEFVRDARGRSFNDRISSVRFEGPVRVAIFENSQFRGSFTWLNRNTPDLSAFSLGERSNTNWNDAVSSVQVDVVRGGPGVFTAWERRDAERAARAAYRDILGREPDPAGVRFYLGRLLDAGWSDDQLRDALRRSDEFKHRDIGAILNRVYTEELGRPPDPGGAAAYTKALGRGMTEPEFRAELHRSKEAAEHRARTAVTRAYREVLRREPDPAGLDIYMKAMLQKGWDDARVRDTLRRSDEFRALPR
ncbi:MAG: hypothetical protein NTV51_23010 [Verrucomicrobia bacterium]|nr:hypothetical protein [Verrucomicrobiota bacterium]